MFSFSIGNKKGIVERLYDFVESTRVLETKSDLSKVIIRSNCRGLCLIYAMAKSLKCEIIYNGIFATNLR